MLVFVRKASDSYWYDFREVNTLDELMDIYPQVIVERYTYYEGDFDFWDNFKEEDILKAEKAKIQVIIYDDYVE